MEKRIEWIDSLRGLAIILVVWGHWNIPITGEKFIYSFHMPLFFFLSGYLFKNKGLPIRDFIKQKAKGYLIPYFVYAVISIPFGIVFDGDFSIMRIIPNLFFINGKVGWNAPIWFFLVMFMLEGITYYIIRFMKVEYIFGISLVLSGILSLFPYGITFGINIVCLGVTFYCLGIISRREDILNRVNTPMMLIISTVITFVFGVLLNQRVSIYNFELGNFVYFMIAAVSGITMMFLFFKLIGDIRFLTFLGRNTVVIFASHYFILRSIMYLAAKFLDYNIYLNKSWVLSITLTIGTIAIYIVAIPIINKYFPILNGVIKRKSQF